MLPTEIAQRILDAERAANEALGAYHAAAHGDPHLLGDGYRALASARAASSWWRHVATSAYTLYELHPHHDPAEHFPHALSLVRQQAADYLLDESHEDDMPANPDELDRLTARLNAEAARNFLHATDSQATTQEPAT